MGGTNPYIEKAEYELPQRVYTVTFIAPDGVVTKVEVDPAKIPYGPTGLQGVSWTWRWAAGLRWNMSAGGSVPVRPVTSL